MNLIITKFNEKDTIKNIDYIKTLSIIQLINIKQYTYPNKIIGIYLKRVQSNMLKTNYLNETVYTQNSCRIRTQKRQD